MRVWVYTICRNMADVLPFFIRHYQQFADTIFVWDDHSTDGSWELLLSHYSVVPARWERPDGIDDQAFLDFAYEQYPNAAGEADWVMWVDADEFIYHPQLMVVLQQGIEHRFDVIQPEGFNMMHEGMPEDDGRQIWEICKTGVAAPVYSKPVIFNPAKDIYWTRGKHALECRARCWNNSGIKLLHYRYLGYEYTKRRNANNFERCGFKSGDKSCAWTCAPEYNGEHSAEWAAEALKRAVPVIP